MITTEQTQQILEMNRSHNVICVIGGCGEFAGCVSQWFRGEEQNDNSSQYRQKFVLVK